MKIAIIYRSFFWTTKLYVKWLKDALGGDIFTFKEIDSQKLKEYDTVVVCSGAYVGWMPLVGFLKKWWESLKEKKVVALAISISPIEDLHLEKFFEQMPEQIEKNVKFFRISDKIISSTETKKESLSQVIKYITE